MTRLTLYALCLACSAHAQNACVVDVVFPSGVVTYSSDHCWRQMQCFPSPVGCSSKLALFGFESAPADTPLSYAVLEPDNGLRLADANGFVQAFIAGTFLADGVMMASDGIFADSFE